MCSVSKPEPPPVPPPPVDYDSQQAAIATEVQDQNQRRLFAGLASTIATGAGGVLSKTRTTRGAK